MKAIDFLHKESNKETALSFLHADKEPSKKEKSSGILKSIKQELLETPSAAAGLAEAATTVGTGWVSMPIAGLTELAASPFVGLEKAKKAGEWVGEKLTYQPKTKQGKALIGAASYPFEKLSEVGEKAGDLGLKKTGSAAVGALIKTGVEALPMLIPGVKAIKGKKIPKTKSVKPKSIKSEFITEEFAKEFLHKRDIPEFKTTGEAVKFGKKATNSEKIELQKLLDEAKVKGAKLQKEGKLQESGDVGFKAQLYHEALQAAEGRKFKKKPPTEYVTAAIVKDTEGTIYKARTHHLALEKLDASGKTYQKGSGDLFITNKGRVLSRGKATKLTKQPTADAQEIVGKTLKSKADSTKFYGGFPLHKLFQAQKKYIGDPIWDKAIMKGIPKVLEKVPGGKAINRAFIYEYRGNLAESGKFVKSMDAMKRNQAIGREYAIDIGNRLQAVDEATQLKMGEYIKGGNPKLSKNEMVLATEAKEILYDLGKQSVELGLLSEKTFFKNAGRYMPRLYTSKEYQSLLTQFNVKKPNRLDLSRFKKRKDIPKAVRQEMGEILTPGYPVAKGIIQLTHDIEMGRFFKNVAGNKQWALPKKSSTAIPKDWKQLPSDKKLGALSEAYVHPEIFADISEVIKIRTLGDKIWRKSLGAWKYGKVILSPKTHARNLMSNSILAHLGGMPMPMQPIYLTKAVKAMRGKTEYWKIAKREGLLSDTFTNAELRTLFNEVEGKLKGIKANGIPEKLGLIGNAWSKTKTGLGKVAKVYEAEEQWFKMAKFIHNIERRKMNPIKAAKDAEKWLFNYSKVTKFQEKYRSKWYGAPFATFTFKALPRIAEAAVKNPHRFILPAAMIYGLEKAASNYIGDTKEQETAKKELRPDYQKGKTLGIPNYPRVPIVDDYGREYYLNLTYILPWGDIAEGGGFMGIPGGLRPFSQPFVNEPVQQIANYDFFWKDPIVKEKDLAGKTGLGKVKAEAKARLGHLAQTMAPTPVLDIAKGYAAAKGIPDYKGRERPKHVVAADVFTGVKMYPVSYLDQLTKKINKLHPKKGKLGREIRHDIKTLHIRRKAMIKKGKDVKFLDKQIDNKIKQLIGLAEEVKKVSKTYKKATK